MELLTPSTWVGGGLRQTPYNPSTAAGNLVCFQELNATDSRRRNVIMTHPIDLIAEFLVCKAHTSIIDHPGLLKEHSGAFAVITNGHKEAIDDVLGYCFSILFNRYPFAVLSATGQGSMGTG